MPIVCSSFVQPYQKTYHIPLGKKQYFTTHSFQRYWCIHLIASQGIRWGSHHCQRCHRRYHCLDYHCRNKVGHCVHCCLDDDGCLSISLVSFTLGACKTGLRSRLSGTSTSGRHTSASRASLGLVSRRAKLWCPCFALWLQVSVKLERPASIR